MKAVGLVPIPQLYYCEQSIAILMIVSVEHFRGRAVVSCRRLASQSKYQNRLKGGTTGQVDTKKCQKRVLHVITKIGRERVPLQDK